MPPYGRGGAGNIEVQQSEEKRIAEDVEAQQSVQTSEQASSHPEYAYSGRGGAGNIYSPKQLAETGSFVSQSSTAAGQSRLKAADSTRSGSSNNTAIVARMTGRGGIGNYDWSSWEAENDDQAQVEEAKKREIEQSVAEGVAIQLAPPPKAVIPHEVLK